MGKHKEKKIGKLKRKQKYSVRHNGIVTSVSLSTSVVSMFLVHAECKINPHTFMKKTVKSILNSMTTDGNKYLSEIVTYKLLELLIDDKKDKKRFYKFAAELS